jgi:integrase
VRGHHEGSIYRRKRGGKWTAAVSMPDGRRRYRAAEWYDNTRERAKELLRELLEERDAELDIPARRLTVASYLRSWVNDLDARPATIVAYRGAVENHIIPALGNVALDRLGPTAIQRWLDSLDMAPASKAKVRAVLRAALNAAVRRRKLVRSPLDGTEPIRVPEHRAVTLTAEQAGLLLASTADDPYGALWAVLIGSGLRISEALALTWDGFDGKAITVRYQLARRDGEWVRVTTKARRSVEQVALPAFASEALSALKVAKGNPAFGHCFLTPAGFPPSEQQALFALYAAEKRLGLPKVKLHELRHTSATLLQDAGVPLDVRKARLGHTTDRMAGHYSHGGEPQDRLAADALNEAVGGVK